MKKILFFLCFLAFTATAHSQLLGKKKLGKHTSQPGYFWFRPVIDVDTVELSDYGNHVNTKFLVEGFLSSGEPIEVFVEGKTLRHLLRLPAKGQAQNSASFEGFMFTVKSLGKNSFQKKRYIDRSEDYYDKQKERLLRERNTEKYELWSEAPTKVTGKLIGTKIVPVDVETPQEEPEDKPADKKEPEKKEKEEPKKPKRNWGS